MVALVNSMWASRATQKPNYYIWVTGFELGEVDTKYNAVIRPNVCRPNLLLDNFLTADYFDCDR